MASPPLAATIRIRALEADDLQRIVPSKDDPAWNADPALWQGYLTALARGDRQVLLAMEQDEIVGYGTLMWHSEYAPFAEQGIPEINNLVVAKRARRLGIASRLIARFEQFVAERQQRFIGIGVGLYPDYGPAQRLYVKLGYVPDGCGITYAGSPVAADQNVAVDDDLILWLTKAI